MDLSAQHVTFFTTNFKLIAKIFDIALKLYKNKNKSVIIRIFFCRLKLRHVKNSDVKDKTKTKTYKCGTINSYSTCMSVISSNRGKIWGGWTEDLI